MRISDWSSDVCSSDLRRSGSGGASARGAPGIGSGTRASPSRRPAAPCRTASSGENSLNAQVIEQRQQRQAQDGEVVAVDAGEELGPQALELIGPDGVESRRADPDRKRVV